MPQRVTCDSCKTFSKSSNQVVDAEESYIEYSYFYFNFLNLSIKFVGA